MKQLNTARHMAASLGVDRSLRCSDSTTSTTFVPQSGCHRQTVVTESHSGESGCFSIVAAGTFTVAAWQAIGCGRSSAIAAGRREWSNSLGCTMTNLAWRSAGVSGSSSPLLLPDSCRLIVNSCAWQRARVKIPFVYCMEPLKDRQHALVD